MFYFSVLLSMILKTILKQFEEKMNALSKEAIPFFFCVSFDGSDWEIIPLHDLAKNNIQIDFNSTQKNTQQLSLDAEAIPFSDYKKQFDQVLEEIHYGNTYLCNLTAPSVLTKAYDLQNLFNNSSALYKIIYKNQWLCMSPECFVKIEDGKIRSYPMKGTIDAQIDDAENILLNDAKEKAEHFTIVDLIRNDLAMVANNIRVKRFRYISEIKTGNGNLLQSSSEIEGDLPKNYLENLGSIITTLLPAGSISGAPKKRTIEIIECVENYARGYYTGIAGVFDGKNLDSCVLIRFIEKINEQVFFKSGGGITKYSQVEKEYDELKQKIYVPSF